MARFRSGWPAELTIASSLDLDRMSVLLGFIQANYVAQYRPLYGRLRWGSPGALTAQISADVRRVNWFHFSIVFNTYLQAMGYSSRLWALEADDGFERFGHTVVEVYLSQYAKWVMLDPSIGCYVQLDAIPVSVPETRRALYGNLSVELRGSVSDPQRQEYVVSLYRRLLSWWPITQLFRFFYEGCFRAVAVGRIVFFFTDFGKSFPITRSGKLGG